MTMDPLTTFEPFQRGWSELYWADLNFVQRTEYLIFCPVDEMILLPRGDGVLHCVWGHRFRFINTPQKRMRWLANKYKDADIIVWATIRGLFQNLGEEFEDAALFLVVSWFEEKEEVK